MYAIRVKRQPHLFLYSYDHDTKSFVDKDHIRNRTTAILFDSLDKAEQVLTRLDCDALEIVQVVWDDLAHWLWVEESEAA